MRPLQNRLTLTWGLSAVLALLLVGSLTYPVHAVPVLITTEGLPGIDLAQRDSAGTLRLFAVEDDNADGVISFVADLEMGVGDCIHIRSGPAFSNYTCLTGDVFLSNVPAQFPFIITGGEQRVITEWSGPLTLPVILGQPLSVAAGQLPGWDAVVYLSPGGSVADIIDLDLTALPPYTGPAHVGGLVRYQIIPEPSTLALAAFGAFGLLIAARRELATR